MNLKTEGKLFPVGMVIRVIRPMVATSTHGSQNTGQHEGTKNDGVQGPAFDHSIDNFAVASLVEGRIGRYAMVKSSLRPFEPSYNQECDGPVEHKRRAKECRVKVMIAIGEHYPFDEKSVICKHG